jgi:putative Ca2+/H+ antiporter (TMEM165/GDT1 family)
MIVHKKCTHARINLNASKDPIVLLSKLIYPPQPINLILCMSFLPEAGAKKKASPFTVLFRIFMQAFTMTFVAEWGDRSQITTIILAARENLWGVIFGGMRSTLGLPLV